jgi:hypothetical protein
LLLLFHAPTQARAVPNVTIVKKRGRGTQMPSRCWEEKETLRQDSRKARREMQHLIYF